MDGGSAGSPAGERNRARGSFPGMPETMAASAAAVIYLPAAVSAPLGVQAIRALMAAGAMLCLAGCSLRRALSVPGILRPAAPLPFALREKAARWAQAALLAASVGAGLAWGAGVLEQRRSLSASWLGLPPGEIVSCTGRLASDSRKTSSGASLYDLELEWAASAFRGAEARGRMTVIAEGGPRLSAGAGLRVRAVPPAAGKPAFVEARDLEPTGFASAFDSARARAREAFVSCVSRIESSGGPLLTALMTGDKAGLSPEEESAFKKAGCAHILALSGQHIGILAGMLGFLLIPLLGKRAALALSSAIVVAYLVVTGIQPSMTRAVLSYLLGAAAWFLSRKPRGTTVLAWTFLIAGALQPESPGSASFCLSYGATAGIVLFQERLSLFLSKWLPPKAAQALGASLGACAASAPVSLALFGSFNPSCVLTSTVSDPLVGLMMWIGCLGSLACALLPGRWAAKAAGVLLEIPYRLLRSAVDRGASFPSIALAPGAQRAAACAVLACVLLLLYAWRLYGPPRLRFPASPQVLHGRARLRHAKEIRAELPRVAQRPRQDRLAPRRASGR